MSRSRMGVGLALSIGALVVLALGPGLAIAADGSVSIVEEDEQYKYQPADITVEAGSKVVWTNDSDAPHTVTADDDSFDHDGIDPDESAEQVFDTAGDFAYHCDIHDYMTGTVHVIAAGATQPPTDVVDSAGPGDAPIWTSVLAVLLGALALGAWLMVARRPAKEDQGTAP